MNASIRHKIPACVLDANGIIGLAKAGGLDSISELFTSSYIPSSVIIEVVDPQSKKVLEEALTFWIEERAPSLKSISRVPLLSSS